MLLKLKVYDINKYLQRCSSGYELNRRQRTLGKLDFKTLDIQILHKIPQRFERHIMHGREVFSTTRNNLNARQNCRGICRFTCRFYSAVCLDRTVWVKVAIRAAAGRPLTMKAVRQTKSNSHHIAANARTYPNLY